MGATAGNKAEAHGIKGDRVITAKPGTGAAPSAPAGWPAFKNDEASNRVGKAKKPKF